MSYIFDFDGTNIPKPTTFEITRNDEASPDSGRLLDGTMNKTIVSVKVAIKCTWKHLPQSQSELLLKTVKSVTYGHLHYMDFQKGENTIEVYTSDPQGTQSFNNGTYYHDITLDFIER